MPFGALAIGSAGLGFATAMRKSKFRPPTQPGLKELVGEAGEAQREAIQQQIGLQGSFGSQFLTSQIDAQRAALPDFFRRQQEALQFGDVVANRLAGGDAETRLLTERVRAAQAARGVALSPASAIEEGMQTAALQAQLQQQALGLRQQLAQYSAATPFGVSALQAEQPSLSYLTGLAFNRAQSQLGVDLEAARTSREESMRRNAAEAALFGRLASGFGGAAGGGGFTGFLQGAGLGATTGQAPGTSQGGIAQLLQQLLGGLGGGSNVQSLGQGTFTDPRAGAGPQQIPNLFYGGF